MSNNTEDTGKATSHQIDYSTLNQLSASYTAGVFAFTQEYERHYSILIPEYGPASSHHSSSAGCTSTSS